MSDVDLLTDRDILIQLLCEETHDTIFSSEYSISLMEEIKTPICEIGWSYDSDRPIDEDDFCMDHAWIE